MTNRTVKLLFEAADDLENLVLPKNAEFNMKQYGEHGPGPEPKLNNLCGTVACAAGWLSLMPKWRRRGFKSKWSLIEGDEYHLEHWTLEPGKSHPRGWERMGAEVFGVAIQEIDDIFMSIDCNKEQVAGLFRKLAERYK